jgi:hypothetical protein
VRHTEKKCVGKCKRLNLNIAKREREGEREREGGIGREK